MESTASYVNTHWGRVIPRAFFDRPTVSMRKTVNNWWLVTFALTSYRTLSE